MNITRRPAGYKVEVYDPAKKSRKRYVGTFPTEREAKKEGRAAEDQVARARGKGTVPTVREYRDIWEAHLQRRLADPHDRIKESSVHAYLEQIKPYANAHGDVRLREVTPKDALAWLVGNEDHGQMRWTHGGIRAMFSQARRTGHVDTNPFTDLRLRGSRGRKDLEVATVAQVTELAACAVRRWPAGVGATWHALILFAAYQGMRPGELYGIRWSDIDLKADEVTVLQQFIHRTREFDTPKNHQTRRINLIPQARAALLTLPRPLDDGALVFTTAKGTPIGGALQHYYWDPIRALAGHPAMDFYELRHFCASYLLNDMEIAPADVAHHLGHEDGGELVLTLYGHPSEDLARKRIKAAVRATPATVTAISEPKRSQAS